MYAFRWSKWPIFTESCPWSSLYRQISQVWSLICYTLRKQRFGVVYSNQPLRTAVYRSLLYICLVQLFICLFCTYVLSSCLYVSSVHMSRPAVYMSPLYICPVQLFICLFCTYVPSSCLYVSSVHMSHPAVYMSPLYICPIQLFICLIITTDIDEPVNSRSTRNRNSLREIISSAGRRVCIPLLIGLIVLV